VDGAPWYVTTRPRAWVQEPIPDWVKSRAPYSKGAHGDAVAWIQKRLVRYGYPITTFGTFGDVTQVFVSSHQAWNGLPATGIVDLTTLDSLARIPRRTPSGYTQLEGGVSIAHLTDKEKVDYLAYVFWKNANGLPMNKDPKGVNFVQIRGFLQDY